MEAIRRRFIDVTAVSGALGGGGGGGAGPASGSPPVTPTGSAGTVLLSPATAGGGTRSLPGGVRISRRGSQHADGTGAALPSARRARPSHSIFTRANLEQMRSRLARQLGAELLSSVYTYLKGVRLAEDAERASPATPAAGAAAAAVAGAGAPRSNRKDALAYLQSHILGGRKELMPVCAQVDELLFLESIVAQNEARVEAGGADGVVVGGARL